MNLLLHRTSTVLAYSTLSLISFSTAQANAPSRTVLAPGTVIPVRLDQELSSKTAHTGDRFTATVRFGSDDAGMPEATRIEGVVRESQRSQNGDPGVLDLDFRRMVTPGGQSRAISGSLIALEGKDITSTNGRLVASANKSKDRLKFIGIGAGSGLLIGKLTKNNALVSTLLGASAGYLFNELGNKPKAEDVSLKTGSEFGIRLDQPLTFDSNRETASNDLQTNNDIGMLVDDHDVSFGSAKPFLRSGQVLVPLDTLANEAHFRYHYSPTTHRISARNGSLSLALNSRVAVLGGKRSSLPIASELRNGAVYVPLQFISLASSSTAVWDANSRTIIVTTVR